MDVLVTAGPQLKTIEDFNWCVEQKIKNYRIHLAKTNSNNIDIYNHIKVASKKANMPVNIFLDMPSDRLRLGDIVNKKEDCIKVKKGDQFILFVKNTFVPSYENKLSQIELPGLEKFIKDIETRDILLIKDGNYKCIVTSNNGHYLKTKCVNNMTITKGYSCLWPNSNLSYNLIDDKMKKVLNDFKNNNITPNQYILSFVNNKEDVVHFKEGIQKIFGKIDNLNIMAKIETKSALNNLEDIISVSNSLMLGRGDLAPQIGFENMPKAQEEFTSKAKQAKIKYCIATQALKEYATFGRVYAAELMDIALAYYQKADLLMLSGESSVSKKSKENIIFLKELINNYKNLDLNTYKLDTIKIPQTIVTLGNSLESSKDLYRAMKLGVNNYRVVAESQCLTRIKNLIATQKLMKCDFHIYLEILKFNDLTVSIFLSLATFGIFPKSIIFSKIEDLSLIKKAIVDFFGSVSIELFYNIYHLSDIDKAINMKSEIDGVIVCREALLNNIAPSELVVLQSEILSKFHSFNKQVVISSQFLEKFSETKMMNRAEISGISFITRVRADYIMLAKETHGSKYPIPVINVIQKIFSKI